MHYVIRPSSSTSLARLGPNSHVFICRSPFGFHCVHCSIGPDLAYASRTTTLIHLLRHLLHWNRVPASAFYRVLTAPSSTAD